MELPDVYRKWSTTEQRVAAELQRFEELDVDDARHAVDPGDLAVASVAVGEAFAAAGDDDGLVRAMFELQDDGYSLEEIADMLDTTEAVVRTRMSRARAAATRGR